jgi:hypothetical protein
MPAPRNADEATAIDSAILNIARPDVLSKKGNGETAKRRNSETAKYMYSCSVRSVGNKAIKKISTFAVARKKADNV